MRVAGVPGHTRVAEVVGDTLVRLGVRMAFGVVGSGNFLVTNALIHAGATFVAARHEAGATTMADAWTRTTGGASVGVVTVHQGCGLTNAMTGLAEAAKSRTPLLVLAAQATQPGSNFNVDQDGLAAAVGASWVRIEDPATVVADVVAAYRTACTGRRTVLVNLPLDVQELPAEPAGTLPAVASRDPVAAGEAALTELVELVEGAERPVFVAGRGARGGREPLVRAARRSGALLATSAVANGLVAGDEADLGIVGGFASDLTAELVRGADLVVAWGCSLTMWSTRHGRLIAPDATVVQVLDEAAELGRHHRVDLGIVGDAAATAGALAERLTGPAAGYRTPEVLARVAAAAHWWQVPVTDDTGTPERIDPRVLSIELDRILPVERTVAIDSGNFMGYPSAYLRVPDEAGYCMTQSFQSVGLGLASAVGAALARPDRLCVAAVGDGGLLMAAAELETIARLGLPMLVVVYDDAAYGAEVHHFAPGGADLSTVRFPDADLAAIARGYGFDAAVVRSAADLSAVRDWLDAPGGRPMLVDAKVTVDRPSWWLEDAFGH